jgi:hypothetical protein
MCGECQLSGRRQAGEMSNPGEVPARLAKEEGFADKSGSANLKASAESADNSSKQGFAGWMGTLHEAG